MNLSIALTSVIVMLPMLLVGVLFWFGARTRRGVFFGVSVPLPFPESARARNLTTLYRARIAALTAVAIISALPPFLRELPWLPIVAVPCMIGGGAFCWVIARRHVLHAAVAAPVERNALVGAAHRGLGAIAALAAALIPLLGTWLYVRARRSELPARFPSSWDFNGAPNGWTLRSDPSLYLPIILGVPIIVLMLGVAYFVRSMPAADRQRAQEIMLPTLAALGWTLSALFCALMLLSLHPRPQLILLVVAGDLAGVMSIVVWMIRRAMRTQGCERYDSTPDAGWRAGGLVYYNPADFAVMVPQRFGWGWTLNYARRAAWIFTAVAFVFAAAMVMAALYLRQP